MFMNSADLVRHLFNDCSYDRIDEQQIENK